MELIEPGTGSGGPGDRKGDLLPEMVRS